MLIVVISCIAIIIQKFSTRLDAETNLNLCQYQITSDNLTKWIEELALCESSNNPLAINPKDKDNRPKYGLFQFDIETWKMYIKRYKLFNYENWEEADWWNAIYSGYHQEIVLREMIKNNVGLRKEFGCIKKIGLFDKFDVKGQSE